MDWRVIDIGYIPPQHLQRRQHPPVQLMRYTEVTTVGRALPAIIIRPETAGLTGSAGRARPTVNVPIRVGGLNRLPAAGRRERRIRQNRSCNDSKSRSHQTTF